MINNVVNLFDSLLTSCLQFTDIILFMTAVCMAAVFVTVVVYLVKGKY